MLPVFKPRIEPPDGRLPETNIAKSSQDIQVLIYYQFTALSIELERNTRLIVVGWNLPEHHGWD